MSRRRSIRLWTSAEAIAKSACVAILLSLTISSAYAAPSTANGSAEKIAFHPLVAEGVTPAEEAELNVFFQSFLFEAEVLSRHDYEAVARVLTKHRGNSCMKEKSLDQTQSCLEALAKATGASGVVTLELSEYARTIVDPNAPPPPVVIAESFKPRAAHSAEQYNVVSLAHRPGRTRAEAFHDAIQSLFGRHLYAFIPIPLPKKPPEPLVATTAPAPLPTDAPRQAVEPPKLATATPSSTPTPTPETKQQPISSPVLAPVALTPPAPVQIETSAAANTPSPSRPWTWMQTEGILLLGSGALMATSGVLLLGTGASSASSADPAVQAHAGPQQVAGIGGLIPGVLMLVAGTILLASTPPQAPPQ